MEFKDRAAFRAWLEEQRREVCVAIAARSALRVWPLVLAEDRLKDRETQIKVALPSGCAVIVASLAAQASSAAIVKRARAASDAAAAAAYAYADNTYAAAYAAARAAAATTASAYASAADDAAGVAAAANAYADADFGAETMLHQYLWHGQGWPEDLDPAKLGPSLLDDSDFAFLRRWFFAMAEGKPLPTDLMTRIALEIDQDVWDSGDPKAVAAAIEAIETDWLAQQLPQADTVVFDTEKAEFQTVPVQTDAEKLLERVLKQVGFALDTLKTSNCGVNSNCTAWQYIIFSVEDCRDDAVLVETNFQIAKEDIEQGLSDDTYQPDRKLTALVSILEQSIEDLRANHPEVAEAWAKRIRFRLKDIKADQRQMIAEKTKDLIALSSDKLARELTLDANLVANGKEGPARDTAIRRFFGRLAQVRLALMTSDVVRGINENTGYQAASIALNINSVLQILIG